MKDDTWAYHVTPGAPAASCFANSECQSGFCVDGVCCATACGGGNSTDCQACSVAAGGSIDGTCGPIGAGQTCRPSSGPCDPAEKCDGVALACPADTLAPATLVCRPAIDFCDQDTKCTGTAATCPLAHTPQPAGTVCRPSARECDQAETCDGANVSCPLDSAAADGAPCTNGVCQSGACVAEVDAAAPDAGRSEDAAAVAEDAAGVTEDASPFGPPPSKDAAFRTTRLSSRLPLVRAEDADAESLARTGGRHAPLSHWLRSWPPRARADVHGLGRGARRCDSPHEPRRCGARRETTGVRNAPTR